WLASAALVVLLAGRIGIAPRELPLVVLAWGALATVGGLGADDVLAGRRQAGVGVRVAWLVPPVTLGALAIPGGLACIVGSGSVHLSTWALVGAAVYLVIAFQLRAGSVTAASWALLTFAGTQLWPRDPMGTTLLFVPAVAVLLVAARTVRPRRAGVDAW